MSGNVGGMAQLSTRGAAAQLELQPLGRLDHLTFKGNLKETRYGWLRLTPAYSVHLVAELLETFHRDGDVVLDPFCGTGTTALVCAERGVSCDTTDINPFLLWLARAKAASYSNKNLTSFREQSARVCKQAGRAGASPWVPPLHQIEKWWSKSTLDALGRAMSAIRDAEKLASREVVDLLKIAFCRVMIGCANVSFGHQSMSFKKTDRTLELLTVSSDAKDVVLAWERAAASIFTAAASKIPATPSPILCDARDLRSELPSGRYGLVVTSPPYPNRMSYIRELRPYMYWLGYLEDGRQAGELDWKAIGGTWGCATSNVTKWKPEHPAEVPYKDFKRIIAKISAISPILGPYVAKYFDDMVRHCESLFAVLAPGGSVHYIVGNSKFYDVMVPVEHIYAAMFEDAGFGGVDVKTIRKRSSKKELFEFVVSARKPVRR